MSLIGKGASSLRKKDVMEQKGIALGFKKIRFAHKATLGDAGIDLTSLVQPTEMATYGFLNPSIAELSRAQINLFRNNLKLVSSTKGLLIDQLSYVVASATRINFIDFTADDGEIFTGWLDETPTTSLSVVDGQNIVASGILLAGQTDFNIGMPIPINQNDSQQIGAVMVFADRGLQYRKVGNQTSGAGDYIEVPVAGGLGSLIRFNPSGSDRFITVMSNGVVAERPDGSMTAMIERAQGQIDQMIPTLAALTGLPETTWQTAPNSVDLKQFGDVVLNTQAQIDAVVTENIAQQVDIDDHETRITTLENYVPHKWQRKLLSATLVSSTADIASLRFNNLTIGKTYRVTAQARIIAGDDNGKLEVVHSGTIIAQTQNQPSGAGPEDRFTSTCSVIFVAIATQVRFDFVENVDAQLEAGGTPAFTWSMLEELPDSVNTSEWT